MDKLLSNPIGRKAGNVPLVFHHRMVEKKNKLTSLMSFIIGGYASASSALARLSNTDERKDPSQMRVLYEEMKRRLRCFQNQKLNKTQL